MRLIEQVIQIQNAQIETLLKKLGKKRLLLDDDQQRLLAVKAYAIGRKALLEITTIFTLDTILRWHRELVEKKFDSIAKKTAVHEFELSSWIESFASRGRIRRGDTIEFREH